MAWIRVDDHFDEHPKMQRIGPLGWGVWIAGLAYCNRNLTDGFIPWAKARTLASFDVVEEDGTQWSLSRVSGMAGEDIDAEWVIALLVDAGLWDVVENGKGRTEGFRVHDYSDYQPSAEKITAERDANARRQEAFRNRLRNANSNAVSNGVSNGPVTTPPTPTPTLKENSSSSSSSSHASAPPREDDDDDDDDDEFSPIDDGFTPTYPATLGKHWPVAVGIFTSLFPAMPTPTIEAMLGDVERDVGPLTRKQLQSGLEAVQDCLKRANGSITHVRPYVRKVITEKFREVANVHA